MALTLAQALGRPIQDLEDATMAQVMFGFVKHGYPDHDTAHGAAVDYIDNMSNSDFLQLISIGLTNLEEARREAN